MKWLLNCLQNFDEDSISTCEWCDETSVGGDLEWSHLYGCSMCEGMLGWSKDEN